MPTSLWRADDYDRILYESRYRSLMFSKPLVVLMTATLSPGSYANAVCLSEIQVRTDDYITALRFWLQHRDPRISGIVFCENSGSCCKAVAEQVADVTSIRPVELLGFFGNEQQSGVHYGYSELGIIDYALENSRILRLSEYFVKVTGRLTFPCISRLLDTLDENLEVAVDHRRSYRNESEPPLRARTQLMVFQTRFYRTVFFRRRDEMLGCYSHLEQFVAAKLLPYRNQLGVTMRWKNECQPVGFTAHGQGHYETGKARLKSKLRGFLRRFAPGIWW